MCRARPVISDCLQGFGRRVCGTLKVMRLLSHLFAKDTRTLGNTMQMTARSAAASRSHCGLSHSSLLHIVVHHTVECVSSCLKMSGRLTIRTSSDAMDPKKDLNDPSISVAVSRSDSLRLRHEAHKWLVIVLFSCKQYRFLVISRLKSRDYQP